MEINDNTFNSLINSGDLVLVDFYSPSCGPCQQLMPIVDKLAPEYKTKGITLVKMNTYATTSWNKYNIRSVPALLLFKDGKIIQRLLVFPITESNMRNVLDKFIS